jgi:hypothetical protein
MIFLFCKESSISDVTPFGSLPPDNLANNNHSDGNDSNGDKDFPHAHPSSPHIYTAPELSVHDNVHRAPPLPRWAPPQNELAQRLPWQPRRSCRDQSIPTHPGNIYGENCLPTDIFCDADQDWYWNRLFGQEQGSSWTCKTESNNEPVPGLSSSKVTRALEPVTNEDDLSDLNQQDEMMLERDIKEGGNQIVHFLVSKAVLPTNELMINHLNMTYHAYHNKNQQNGSKHAMRS